MEPHTSKKAKAAGAFRNFFNTFLQRPTTTKRKHPDTSPGPHDDHDNHPGLYSHSRTGDYLVVASSSSQRETNTRVGREMTRARGGCTERAVEDRVATTAATAVTFPLEASSAFPWKKRVVQVVAHGESSSLPEDSRRCRRRGFFPVGEVGRVERAAASRSHNQLTLHPGNRSRHPDASRRVDNPENAGIRSNGHDVDDYDEDVIDDEVFLDDSYFEDDYTEDYSSSNDDPMHVDDVIVDFPLGGGDPYWNNLDEACPGIEKDYYNKVLNLSVSPPREPNPCLLPLPLRSRHHSMPEGLTRHVAKDAVFDNSIQNFEAKLETQETVLYHREMASHVSGLTDANQGRNAFANCSKMARMDLEDQRVPAVVCREEGIVASEMANDSSSTSNTSDSPVLQKLSPADSETIHNPLVSSDLNTDIGMSSSQRSTNQDNSSGSNSSASPTLPPTHGREQLPPLTVLNDLNADPKRPSDSLVVDSKRPNSVEMDLDSNSSPTGSDDCVFVRYSATAAASSRDGQQQRRLDSRDNRRCPFRVSVESGYGSTGRFSTPSTTPLPPLLPPSAPAKTATPFLRLHTGAVLSPHSLNALDGIKKPRPSTPRRKLRPKFIFPPYAPAVATADILQSVPEIAGGKSNSLAADDQRVPDREEYYDHPATMHGSGDYATATTTTTTTITKQPRLEPSSSENRVQTSSILSSRLVSNTGLVGLHRNWSFNTAVVDLNNNNLAQPSRHENACSDKNNRMMPYHHYSPSHRRSLPPKKEEEDGKKRILIDPVPSQTPTTRHPKEELAGFLSPFGKALRPICTSSPLQGKVLPHSRCQRRKGVVVAPGGTPLNKLLLLDSSAGLVGLSSPTKRGHHGHHGGHRGVRSVPTKKTTPVSRRVKVESGPKSTTERRRKKLKRSSARARLLFNDEEDCGNKKDEGRDKGRDEEDGSTSDDQQVRPPMSRDYILLKRIAESIVDQCPQRRTIEPFVDLPSLMENLNAEYSKIARSFGVKSNPKLSNLRTFLESSGRISDELTVENCVRITLMTFLVQDRRKNSSSLDFVFENLSKVSHHHAHFSSLAPEIVVLLLSNPRCIVKNGHHFPLPYSSSEMEVFKTVVNYVELAQNMNTNSKTSSTASQTRVKNLLATVADAQILSSYASLVSVDFDEATNNSSHRCAKNPPRRIHHINFLRTSPFLSTRDNENNEDGNANYFFQPFISNSVQSLDDLTSSNEQTGLPNNDSITNPRVGVSSLCQSHYNLRKIYFSFRRSHHHHHNVPFITKIGMQYSCRGKKRTYFIAQQPQPRPPHSPTRDDGDEMMTLSKGRPLLTNDGRGYEERERGNYSGTTAVPGISSGADTGVGTDDLHSRIAGRSSPETAIPKKTAIVLGPGEHVTGLSVLGESVVHNVEVVTNTGRRVRAHGIDLPDLPDSSSWVAIATPRGSPVYCLQAIYGNVQKFAGRPRVGRLGAVWMTATYDTDL